MSSITDKLIVILKKLLIIKNIDLCCSKPSNKHQMMFSRKNPHANSQTGTNRNLETKSGLVEPLYHAQQTDIRS